MKDIYCPTCHRMGEVVEDNDILIQYTCSDPDCFHTFPVEAYPMVDFRTGEPRRETNRTHHSDWTRFKAGDSHGSV